MDVLWDLEQKLGFESVIVFYQCKGNKMSCLKDVTVESTLTKTDYRIYMYLTNIINYRLGALSYSMLNSINFNS